MNDLDLSIAANLKALRAERGLTLDRLSQVSGVSRAMISRIERGEASPTALLLSKLCAALGTSLSAFFADSGRVAEPIARAADQPVWRDPDTGYVRRAVSPNGVDSSVDIVSVRFPPGARIDFPPEPAVGTRQYLWVLEGTMTITVATAHYDMSAGDCLFMAVADPHSFLNPGVDEARYAVIIERR